MSPWYARDARAWTCPAPDSAAQDFHRQLPGYAPTPLAESPELAAELGVGRLFVKDESARFDLRAFKFLGASWAGFLAVSRRSGYAGPATLDGLRAHLAAAGGSGLSLVTATDGNHGRAVARTARLLGLPARVYVPQDSPAVVIARIAAERAQVIPVDASYDATVAAARADAGADGGALLVQDTAWPGYEEIPGWIVAGYETLFAELDAQLAAAGGPSPALLAVPVGVGSLAQAAVAHYRRGTLPRCRPAPAAVGRAGERRLRAGQPAGGRAGLGNDRAHGDERPQLRHPVLAGLAVSARRHGRGHRGGRQRGRRRGHRAGRCRRRRRPVRRRRLRRAAGRADRRRCVARRRDLGLDGPDDQPTVVCLSTEGPLSG